MSKCINNSDNKSLKKNITLNSLGYSPFFEKRRRESGLEDFGIGRVIAEHKGRYRVMTEQGEFDAEIVGSMRYSAESRSDFPAVGDWVSVTEFGESNMLIHAIIGRKTVLSRKAVGRRGEEQIIATNIDKSFIVQAIDRDFSINRIERYMAICREAGVEPVAILNKTDLIEKEEADRLLARVKARLGDISVILFSNNNGCGLKDLQSHITANKTYCLLGSSGVGKSTLINTLSGKNVMRTGEIGEIGEGTGRGKHVTTHRQLVILEGGGLLIDNPGMREIGMTDLDQGLELTFDIISEVAEECRFSDCTHTGEAGCAVIEAVEDGDISEDSYENFLKMVREKEHYESTVAEKRRRGKSFAKMVKQVKKVKENRRR
ncbi:ribosome small subunit-dependent GTPase (plasmid) [Fulvitalea axinellae]|uniref:Small ribosomal subunit biogenesis GTPase RsgA n=1 Tax=Fulvitalea axinellae TaxID=1182444 RepID=A0AAU9CS55_9BACT|nr:ribosome small subunit-dependent GTPase [Fulvitalea axinellae]